MSVDHESASFRQGYWAGRGELYERDVTAPKDDSYWEGIIMGAGSRGVVFLDGVNVGTYAPTPHSLADLEAGNVERVPDDD